MEKKELELNEQSVKLQESLQQVANEDFHTADDEEAPDNEEVECEMSCCPENCDTNLKNSKWIQILGIGLVAEQHHLCNAKKGAEFACVHNPDSMDFMNEETKLSEPY